MSTDTGDVPAQESGGRPRQRPRQPLPQTTGEVPALPQPEKPQAMILAEVVTELTRIGQDLTFPIAKTGMSSESDVLGAAFTRLDCGSRVLAQASRLTRLITPDR